MKLYCSNCGLQLKIIRKAMPKFGTIIDLVEPHKCLETPIDPNTIIVEAPVFIGDRDKFVKSLNKLIPTNIGREIGHSHSEGKSLRPSSMTGTDGLRDSLYQLPKDHRFDPEPKPGLKSTAPKTLLNIIEGIENSTPERDIINPKSEE